MLRRFCLCFLKWSLIGLAVGPPIFQFVLTHNSRALAGGWTLAEVRDVTSHTTLLTTSVYLHVAVDDDGSLGNLFGAGGGDGHACNVSGVVRRVARVHAVIQPRTVGGGH